MVKKLEFEYVFKHPFDVVVSAYFQKVRYLPDVNSKSCVDESGGDLITHTFRYF